ncbi:MAG: hypothetical protein HOI01_08200 [Proteobacteria bacterium]|nr:hypothetical protein [Pseudomonadota bacterium]
MTNDKQDQDKERVFRGIWAGQNNEEASFWVDYFGYLLNTVVQSEQTLGATIFALNRYLILIDMRITSFSAAWDLMNLPNRVGKWQGRAAVDKATQEAMIILEVVEKLREQCQVFMAKIIEAVEGKESDFWWVLDNIEKYKIHEAEAAKVIEATGVALGETLMSVEMFNNVRSDLNTGLAKLSEAQIAEVLDTLDIMAPGAESDVEEARQEIVGEATLADKELTGCIILLQAFDLVRQILEHRRNEINIIPEMLGDYKKKEIHWTFLRDKIIDKLYGKMVTEQEKKAFAYFLHYLEPKQEEGAAASAPGDMMLF